MPSPGNLSDPGIEPGSPHCRQILYQLSYQGSPRYTMLYINIRFVFCAIIDIDIIDIIDVDI